MTLRIKDIKTSIVGKPVSGDNDDIGFQIEDYIQQEGWMVQGGPGPDILNAGVEIKGRHIDATSNQTIGRMTRNNIIATEYDHSPIKDKVQRQIRVYHNGETILRATFYDFSDDYIQSLLRDAYEQSRIKLANGWTKSWVPGNKWGNFEQDGQKNTYGFRLSNSAYNKLEKMSKDTFIDFFNVI